MTTKEFWPRGKWPSPPSLIPHPSLWRRFVCWLTLGHLWDTFYWAGMGEPNWPQYDYCLKCWKFREKDHAEFERRAEERHKVADKE